VEGQQAKRAEEGVAVGRRRTADERPSMSRAKALAFVEAACGRENGARERSPGMIVHLEAELGRGQLPASDEPKGWPSEHPEWFAKCEALGRYLKSVGDALLCLRQTKEDDHPF